MNDHWRSIELLNETHDFPAPIMFKAIGKNRPTFVAQVVAAVRLQLELECDPPFHVRETPHGRHVAVTLEPLVPTAADVLAIYDALRAIDGLVMLM